MASSHWLALGLHVSPLTFQRLTFADLALVVVVSLQATALAYLHAPRWKALMLSLPLPFTLATLSLGRPVNATNVLALVVLLAFTHAVRLLSHRARVPIVPAIVLSALGYCVVGGALAHVVPDTNAVFWGSCAAMLLLGGVLYRLTPHREEPGHRSPLPVWIKLPAIALVILLLVAIKQTLQGFMTLFPMVGVIGAYEARHSLWTMSRQIPVVMLTLVPLMVTCRLLQGRLGLGPALAVGWGGFVGVLVPLTRALWKREA